MTDDLIVNSVHSTTTHIFGRSLNSSRMHHFVIDGSTEPKEELTPVEVFLSGVSSCAVHLLERFAWEDDVTLNRAEAHIEARRTHAEPWKFEFLSLRLELHGPTQPQAEALVDRFKRR